MNPGGEVGSWDVVLLEDLNEDNLISNLNQRYKWDQVYVSNVPATASMSIYSPVPSLPDVCGDLPDIPEPSQASGVEQ